jgi:hypothetical protein
MKSPLYAFDADRGAIGVFDDIHPSGTLEVER